MSGAATLHDLGPASLIPLGEGRVYQVGERDVAVFRSRTGSVHATEAACPHRGGPLADGLLGDGCVVCPLHGYTFELATGRARLGTCRDLITYPASIDADGRLFIEV